jgi:hypothetical protein
VRRRRRRRTRGRPSKRIGSVSRIGISPRIGCLSA